MVFFPRRQTLFYEGNVFAARYDSEYCILREETVRERRGSYIGCCRLYPFICWIIIKEGPDNFSSGRSPHWVNHVYLCLYCILYLLCFISAFVLFYFSAILFF
jgi:hypothetical protein